jgi:microcystin-dependent protein
MNGETLSATYSYTLPTASASTKGGIKVGSGLSMNGDTLNVTSGFKVGDMKEVAYNGTIEDGWLLCDGAAVSRTTYAKLFAVIGTTYGVGNGSTTFNLPNRIDNVAQGSATAGTVKRAGLPNIIGSFVLRYGCNNGEFAGANYTTPGVNLTTASYGGSQPSTYMNFDASRSNSIYGSSTTVQPAALTCRVLIKYE